MGIGGVQRRVAIPILIAGAAILIVAWNIDPYIYAASVIAVGSVQFLTGLSGLVIHGRATTPPHLLVNLALVLLPPIALGLLRTVDWA